MMLQRRLRLPLCLSLLLSASALAVADEKDDLARNTPVPSDQQIPLVDFFRPAVMQQPRINPSGSEIGALVASGDKHLLMVYNLKTLKKELVDGGNGDKDIYAFDWLDDKRLVFEVSTRKLYGLGFFATEVGSLGDIYPLEQYYGTSLVSVIPTDRLHPLVWNRIDSFHGDGKDLGVARLNTDLRGGKIVNLAAAGSDWSSAMDARDNNVRHIIERFPVPEPGIGIGYWADVKGNLSFAETVVDGLPIVFRYVDGKWVRSPVDLDDNGVYGIGTEPDQLVALGPRSPGKPRPLQFLNAKTGAFGDVLVPEKSYDFVGSLYYDPISYDIIGATSYREGPHTIWFTDAYTRLQTILNGYFPGLFVRVLHSNQAQNIFLVESFSDTEPRKYSWVDLEKKSFGLIQNSRPWIDPKRMQHQNIIKFKTRDGRMLDAYLTLPAGASKAKPAPLVVVPHGGPWVRDYWGYDSEAQFRASRGYAVLKPNYRGSPGTDWMFPESDEWDFLKMHYDVTDATKAVLATGLVDSRRVAIMGGSFGGYLALAGVVNDPTLYRCAVTIAGVFDWEKLISDKKWDYEHSASDPEFLRLMRKLGDPKKQPEKFDAISPVRHVDQIKVPVFVNHGGYDPISDITQSTRLISELDKYHVPHESLIVSEETHGMAHLSNEMELYARIEAFLAKNMAPEGPAGGAAGSP
jgi:acetyl esterase/lipase